VSLLQQLAAKTRRHVVVPVEVSPATDDQLTRANAVRTELVAAAVKGEETTVVRLQADLEAVEAENQAQVSFTAMSSEDFEKVAAVYPSPEGRDAGMDWRLALPVVAAICADDPDLQDSDVWDKLLESWSHGERLALWGALLRLNVNTPEPYIPKG
jgi:hypothetical protein